MKPISPRSYGLGSAFAFVVGTVVGTGIYLKPAQVARLAPEPWHNLALWAMGGVFALCGAIVYAKFASVWPASGGAYIYLGRCYGDRFASMLLATDVILARPAAVGALATGLGLVWGLSFTATLGLALIVLASLTLIQLKGREVTGGLQVGLTILKLLPLFFIALAGLSQPENPEVMLSQGPHGSTSWAGGLLAVLWAYDGWYNVTILGGEVQNPGVTLRRSLVGGVLTVSLIYLGLNALLLQKVSYDALTSEGVAFIYLLSGTAWEPLSNALRWFLSLAILATLNGVLACGPSMVTAGQLDGRGDLLHPRRGILIFSGWCFLMIGVFSLLPSQFVLFDRMSEYTAAVASALSGITVSGLFRLPSLGVRVDWLTRMAAAIFLGIDIFLVVMLVQERPGLALMGLLSVLVASTFVHRWRLRQKALDWGQG